MKNQFCGTECWTGDCGVDGSVPKGAKGKFCQPCKECDDGGDSVTDSCNICPELPEPGHPYERDRVGCDAWVKLFVGIVDAVSSEEKKHSNLENRTKNDQQKHE